MKRYLIAAQLLRAQRVRAEGFQNAVNVCPFFHSLMKDESVLDEHGLDIQHH